MTRIPVPLIAIIVLLAGGALIYFAQPTPAQAPSASTPVQEESLEVATFASGCFWCTESDFDQVKGVKETISGYMGGTTKSPTYAQVSMGNTGHAEVLQLKYDPKAVTYKELVDYYWRHVDLVDGGGQFCDRGSQYRPVIFTHNSEQKEIAEASKAALDKSGRFDKPIAVEIIEASEFTSAEDYHQNYHETHPLQYRYYRYGCGRDARLRQLWGDEATH